MKKTVTYLLCTVLLICVLSACGNDDGRVSPSPTSDVVMTPSPMPSELPTGTPAVQQTPDVSASPNVSASPGAQTGPSTP